ncbi:SDR family NAD(P)-dependent oxidoreductase [Couchioplanes azureus]|uniref:SDR family NAD(P)-dependent oxidoreductase n=1 Tax=Couchioplanes caeruleus TaxID=56438 RepID=UPI001671759D|nr:SDR family oxidoreductase [Couchioplanes caeruleus]GGQ47879.1 dehydrogenase [Couchioplanes caeruleus subsp. azureus]
MEFHGRAALITGASSGIGAAYAREFAARGADLVLVARSEGAMHRLADELRGTHGRQVHVVPADLAEPGAADRVATRVAALGVDVDVLVNNAGFGMHGDFAAADAGRITEQIQLNCVALVDLTRRFLPAMVARGRGAVVNVASTAAFQPLPHMAVYGATKAFVLSFSEALYAEVKPAGVRVVAICPGATETPFFDVAGEDAAVGKKRTPQQVVATTLAALGRGRPSRVDGLANALLAVATRWAPRRMVIAMAGRLTAPREQPVTTTG